MTAHPQNPTLDAAQRPASNGLTRKNKTNGGIDWFDPANNTWRDAVRLDDIREKLIQAAATGGKHYKYPKAGNEHGEDPLNVTSFLEKDEMYGYDRDNRPEILFTLHRPEDRKSEDPTTYLTDEGRVCLDPYLHGIRDFPNILPRTISADVDGQDIEYWQRQNGKITRYDIMARMPSSHTTKGRFYSEPPSLNTLTQRTSRFRAKAGCLMWNVKRDSDKNDIVLSLLPADCKKAEVNSTRTLAQDLDKDQKLVRREKRKRRHLNKRHRREHTEEADEEEARHGDDGMTAESSSITSTRTEASDSCSAKVNASVAPNVGRRSSTRRPQLARTWATDTIPETMGRNKRGLHRVSSAQDLASEEGDEQAPKRRKAGKVAKSTPKTTGNTRTKVNEKEGLSSYPFPEEHHLRPTPSPSAAPRYGLSEQPIDWETSHSHVETLHDRVGVTGALAQYVIEMADDSEPMYEPRLAAETRAATALNNPDYRYMTPHGRATDIRDRANVRRALELTCIDFCQRRGHAVPRDLLAEHHNESYMSQFRKIQAEFDRVWQGESPVKLYCLPAWTKGFDKWKVPRNSDRGAQLKYGAVHSDGGVIFYGLLDQEKQEAKLRKS